VDMEKESSIAPSIHTRAVWLAALCVENHRAVFQWKYLLGREVPFEVLFSSASCFAVTQLSVFATGSVTLAWNACTDPNVAGYNVYYGGASGAYTNEICAGKRNQCNHFRPGRGSHLLFCGHTYAAFGHGKSVLKRGVLSGSPECSDCWFRL